MQGNRYSSDGQQYDCYSHEKEANFEATCHTPFEPGASNIDWLQQMYDAIWQQLEENTDNNA